MWLLTLDERGQDDEEVFKNKKKWLRPGKKYLVGRAGKSVNEPGQIIIMGRHVSRKHLTIEIANVPEGEGTDLSSRAKVTVQDLDTKLGSWVNGKSITGECFDLIKDDNEIRLGKQDTVLRIQWHPVVFSFSFTKAEVEQANALVTVQQALEPLDIKYVTDNRANGFTHLVSKKRNSSRVMQALINCQLIVSQAFTDAVVRAAVPEPDQNGVDTSPLEQDFEAHWPDAAKFVPNGPEGKDIAFAPDERRREVFEGYTFIFYDKRYENVLPVITAGKGKALLRKVVPRQTNVDDFVRYVKSIAGEKGLGEFEDGSEGKGVVVVRYTPTGDGEEELWYRQFFNEFALRLDHRPIEIRDLLFAVLDVEPEQLRRPLLLEPTPREPGTQHQDPPAAFVNQTTAMEVDEVPQSPVIEESPSPPPPPARRVRQGRVAAQSRFKSFDVGLDSDEDEPSRGPTTQPQPTTAESQGMFMTQQSDAPPVTQSVTANERKRPASIMDLVAPTAARNKRQRLERGEQPVPTPPPRTPTPEPEPAPAPARKGRAAAGTRKGKGKKAADASADELDVMIERGQEEEAARRAEDELLRRQLEGGEIDFDDIRATTTTHTMPIRRRQQQLSSAGDEDRWNPRWNGLTNFKKFRPQHDDEGNARARAPPRKIVSVVAVRAKEYGIGDDYWLQDGDKKKGRGGGDTQNQTQRAKTPAVISDVEEEDDDASLPDIADAPRARSRKGKVAERETQTQTQTQTMRQMRTKRAAPPVALEAERPAKKRATRGARPKMAVAQEESDEDSEEDGGIGFRFGKRR
ncbi:hypothetical protein N0V82_004470 [Gnomoniopsis sp. IMI 355080]|nr:hypothetical protein N0V82_004470 [Gnomoniopsis sp. IMI 355080]